MMEIVSRLFARGAPVLSEAGPRDAVAIAALHAASFPRGWSESEFERLLADRTIVAHRARVGQRLAGFILSRLAADEAEILSVAVGASNRKRGVARALLGRHMSRLAGLGIAAVFLEVEEGNAAARRLYAAAGFEEISRREGYYRGPDGAAAAALVLRRDFN